VKLGHCQYGTEIICWFLEGKFKEDIVNNLVFKEGWRISNNELQKLVKGRGCG